MRVDLDENLLRMLAAQRAASDSLRRLSDPAFSALSESRLFHLALPPELGGAQAQPWDLIEAARALARSCPSSAWYVGVSYAHAWLVLAYFGGKIAAEALASPLRAPISGVLAPRGRHAAGLLQGTWRYCSASVHSTWTLMGAQDDACPHRLFLVPTASLRIEHDWNGPGLLATASHRVIAKDLPVLLEHAVDLTTCRPLRREALYQIPRGLILNWALVGTGLGLADLLEIDVSQDASRIREDCLKAQEAPARLSAEEVSLMQQRIAAPIRRASTLAKSMNDGARSQAIQDLLTLSTHLAFR